MSDFKHYLSAVVNEAKRLGYREKDVLEYFMWDIKDDYDAGLTVGECVDKQF